MNFSQALAQLKLAKLVRRASWPVGQYVKLDTAGYFSFRERRNEGGFITSRYIGHISDLDLLANDWELHG